DIRIRRVRSRARLRGKWSLCSLSLATQRKGKNWPVECKFGDLGVRGPEACERHFSADAGERRAAGCFAVPGTLKPDIAHRHVRRWPEANPGWTCGNQPIPGVSLDAVSDRWGQKSGRNSGDQDQKREDNDGRNRAACDFHGFLLYCLMRERPPHSAAGECRMAGGLWSLDLSAASTWWPPSPDESNPLPKRQL